MQKMENNQDEQKIEGDLKGHRRTYETKYKTIASKLPKEVAEAFIDKCIKEKKLPSEKLRELVYDFLNDKEIKVNQKEEKNEWEGW
jgi:hypothetical protein